MKKEKGTSKMFLDVVAELRCLIQLEGIEIGDKLPSERELAERLQVGRSTVREALRSLELLGLIETRRGEGTFLADFQKHQLVEVLAEFIMQQPSSLTDVLTTRRIHERAAIKAICENTELRAIPIWASFRQRLADHGSIVREDLLREMIIATGNRLSLKIWFLLKQYSQLPLQAKTTESEQVIVLQLIQEIVSGNGQQALQSYSDWMNQIEGKRGESNNDT